MSIQIYHQTEKPISSELPGLRTHLPGTKPCDSQPALISEVAGVDQDPKKQVWQGPRTHFTNYQGCTSGHCFHFINSTLSSELPMLRTITNNHNAFLLHFIIILSKVMFQFFGHIIN